MAESSNRSTHTQQSYHLISASQHESTACPFPSGKTCFRCSGPYLANQHKIEMVSTLKATVKEFIDPSQYSILIPN